ncbi:MAG: dTMP kinase [Anaerolineae bacterium]
MPALFVTFEGPEGCGKTTQVRLLAERLRARGYDVLTTREPGGTRIGDQIRAILLDPAHTEMVPAAEILLFSAARAQIVHEVILPHLQRGGVVLCDRFADSTLAYQGYGHGLDLDVLRVITAFATAGLTPDVTFYLDIPVEEGLRRKARAGRAEWNRMEQRELAYHQRVQDGYRRLIAAEPARWVVIDASKSIEEIHLQVVQEVERRLAACQSTTR